MTLTNINIGVEKCENGFIVVLEGRYQTEPRKLVYEKESDAIDAMLLYFDLLGKEIPE